jgi:exonuclease 3'-5' domain-containing protein 1
MVVIVSSTDADARNKFIDAVESALLRAESETLRVGVNLSRIGTIELISICFSTMEVYLVDFSKSALSSGLNSILEYVKRLFESRNVVKIIHDCRMDSDALYHLHHITLVNVHDTSCFHAAITSQEDKNLNDVLVYNHLSSNVHRDKSIYKTNPRFWATRPITTTMIEWATSDVDKLFQLALILSKATAMQNSRNTPQVPVR